MHGKETVGRSHPTVGRYRRTVFVGTGRGRRHSSSLPSSPGPRNFARVVSCRGSLVKGR